MSDANFELREEYESQEWVKGLRLFHNDHVQVHESFNPSMLQGASRQENSADACLSPLLLPTMQLNEERSVVGPQVSGNTLYTYPQKSAHFALSVQNVPSSMEQMSSSMHSYDVTSCGQVDSAPGEVEGFIPTEFGVVRVMFPVQALLPAVLSRTSSVASLSQNANGSWPQPKSSSNIAPMRFGTDTPRPCHSHNDPNIGYTLLSQHELDGYSLIPTVANGSTNVSSMHTSSSSTPVHNLVYKRASSSSQYDNHEINSAETERAMNEGNDNNGEDSDSEDDGSVWEENEHPIYQPSKSKKKKIQYQNSSDNKRSRRPINSSFIRRGSSKSQNDDNEACNFYDEDDGAYHEDDDEELQEKESPQPRRKASEEARNILMNWLVENEAHPYPTKKQKQDLATATGMSLKQIVHWMSNIRKRRMLPLLNGKRVASSMVDIKFLDDMKARRVSLKKRKRDE